MDTTLPDEGKSETESFLASAEEITQLLAGTPAKPAPAPQSTRPDAPPRDLSTRMPSHAARQRCRCGHCSYCLDNARWERIFNEKFADPSYYRRLALRYNSTLAEPR